MKATMIDIKPAEISIKKRVVSTHCDTCEMPFDEQGTIVDSMTMSGVNEHGTPWKITLKDDTVVVVGGQATKVSDLVITCYKKYFKEKV